MMDMDERQAAWAALRMIGEAVGELFGPIASMESEEATLFRGPEYHHYAEAVITAMQRVRDDATFSDDVDRENFYG